MAYTAPLDLPVTLTVGHVTTKIGTLTLDPGETVQSSLAALFRAAADAYERVTAEEVSPDAAAR